MKRYGNLFSSIVTIENLTSAYKKAAIGKRWQTTVRVVENDIDNNLKMLQESLSDKTYTTSPYKIKKIYEPKEREIFILPFYPDRIAQHALMNVLEPIWLSMFIRDSYACIKGRGQHAGSRRLMEMIRHNKYCLKCDVRKFYPSIDHQVLFEIVKRKIKCKDTLWLIEDIIRSVPGGKNIPIGNYTSQWMGNLYLNELDQLLKHQYRIKNYIRYCDDFILLSNDKAQLGEMKCIVTDYVRYTLKMELKIAEVFPCFHGIDFLGYRHFPDGYVLLRKSTATRVKKRIKRLIKMYDAGDVSAGYVESSLASTEGWLRWANTHNFTQRLELDNLIRRFRDARRMSEIQ